MDKIDRRKFSGKIIGGAAAASTLSLLRPERVMGANDRIVMASIGVGGRGQSLARGFLQFEEVEFAYLCDVNETRSGIPELAKRMEEKSKKAPHRVVDLRKVLDDKDVDVTIVATNDHWHGLGTIWACQAGKDVYVEKPPSHNIWEGRKMVEAARKYNRIVQVGTQNRSAPYNHKALEYIKSGKLGSIHLCRVHNMIGKEGFKKGPDGTPPEGFHYDMWLGPAPMRPYNESVVDNWKLLWDFSAGDIADDGIHQLDLARFVIDKDFPKAVHSSGGIFYWKDDREVPDTLVTTYDYDDMVMTFELTQYTPYMKKIPETVRNGDLFPYWWQTSTRIELYGSQGLMLLGRHGGGWQVFTEDGKVVAQEYGRFPDSPHKQNFIDCLKSRQLPNADIEQGHRSACLVHLASISYRVGCRKLTFDKKTERFVDDKEANALVKRTYREPYTISDPV